MLGMEAQGHSTPPSRSPRMISDEPTLSKTAPATSMRCCRRTTCSENLRNRDQAASAQRNVDEEDPPPVQIVDEESAERWSHDCRYGPDAGDVTLNAGAFGHRVDIADDRHRGRLHRAGAESLQGSKCDQSRHAPGDAAQDRAQTNKPMPTSMIGLRPMRSVNLAKIGTDTAWASR